MKSSSRVKYLPRRVARRGAALVEAAVVMPVIVTFLGMMMWFHNLHVTEQDTAVKARNEALEYASHACGKRGASADGSVRDAVGSDDGGKILDSGDGFFQAALSLFFEPATADEHAEAQGALFARDWTHPVHHRSKVMCNEPRYPNGLRGLLPFAKDRAGDLLRPFN